MRAPAALLACFALYGCPQPETEIIAWPGMDAAQFNQLNQSEGASLQTDMSDWIGINSPAHLVFKSQGEEIVFSGWRRGGGIMIASFPTYGANGDVAKPPVVKSINFNIGGGMENLADFHPILTNRCAALAELAGVAPTDIPSAEAISEAFDTTGEAVTDIEVCFGSGADFTYVITASHFAGDAQHGGDPAFAFLDGSLHMPDEVR